ncbi:MAG: IS5 family transposase [Saprospiraceae bacterium]
MTAQYERLTDSQWKVIKDYLPVQRKRRHDLRVIFDAILWITRTGSQWRNLDSGFPPWRAVYYYFDKWSNEGLLELINEALNRHERRALNRAVSPSLGLVDSQSVKLAPMIYEYRGIDGNKKINGRKRQLLTDVLGRIWRVHVHPANEHDSPAGIELLDNIQQRMNRLEKIIGDKAYRGSFADQIQGMGIEFQVPQRPKGIKGFVVEAKRWVVERTIAWLNFFRRVVVDYEHTPRNSAAFLYLANISMVLGKIE